ncbi:MAG: ATP-binding protein [Anaerolineae bacterium]
MTLNPVLIREAIENLISNAIKYTPDGGRICVRAFIQDDQLHFNVEDNGIGIPKEHLPRIFETFYRAKQAGSEGIEGRGLGLSLVKTIIERHGGEVWIESEQGSGSRFGFWILNQVGILRANWLGFWQPQVLTCGGRGLPTRFPAGNRHWRRNPAPCRPPPPA